GGNASIQIGTGVATSAIRNLYTQGAIARTGVTTDLAISGEGFFVVQDPLSTREYATRDGQFTRDEEGYLINSTGLRVQGFSDNTLTTRGDIKIDYPYAATSGNFEVNGKTISVDTNDKMETVLAKISAATEGAVTGSYDPVTRKITLNSVSAIALSTPAGGSNFLQLAELDATGNTGTITSTTEPGDILARLSSFSIDSDGKVNIKLTNGTNYVRGQVLLQRFTDPQALVKEGNNLYSGIDAAGPLGGSASPLPQAANTNGLGRIEPSAVELSNVDLTNEFATMITTQRAFQASARIITTTDEMLSETVNLKR
ncbi:MAG TPA: flagellar hook-basal body complex protein, partial [Candidatus Paceibacterota bacterium]|nr:flagellar hook-basal body complex protein [Candidatus Paceibacterota bacterium]